MDVADWLQALPTSDGAQFLRDGGENKQMALSSEQFCQKFYDSEQGKAILQKVGEETKGQDTDNEEYIQYLSKRYRNTQLDSLKLLIKREMLLWWRDKTQIKARILQGESGRGDKQNSAKYYLVSHDSKTCNRFCHGNNRRNSVLARER